MSKSQLNDNAAISKLKELTGAVKLCMLTTIHNDYSIGSRPMHTVDTDDNGCIWFFTNEFSGKVEDISKDNTVYLMYAHPGQNNYLFVKGTAKLVTDKQAIKERWSPMVKAWFPKGVDDPALALLKVDTTEASFWDSSSNNFVVFYQMLKAIATGEQADMGKFGKLDLS